MIRQHIQALVAYSALTHVLAACDAVDVWLWHMGFCYDA